MFCQKKCSPFSTAMKVLGIFTMVIGVMTVVGFILSKCNCFGRRARRLACECEDAVGNAASRMTRAMSDCMSPSRRGENDCTCD